MSLVRTVIYCYLINYTYANAWITNINNKMNVLAFSSRALSHARTIIMYCYNHLAISSKTSTTVPPFIGRYSRNYRANLHLHVWYRLRFRPQTPSSRTISALNSANVDCFPFAMLNRVSCVNETTLLSRTNLCHWYIRSRSTEPIPADPLVNYSQSP